MLILHVRGPFLAIVILSHELRTHGEIAVVFSKALDLNRAHGLEILLVLTAIQKVRCVSEEVLSLFEFLQLPKSHVTPVSPILSLPFFQYQHCGSKVLLFERISVDASSYLLILAFFFGSKAVAPCLS